MKDCKHCGSCCLSGIPCIFGQILFNITENNPAPCPACEKIDDLYWCGLLKNPQKWLSPMVGDVEWKCEAMADIASIYIGIGLGCGMSPSVKSVAEEMKKRFNLPHPGGKG